MMNSEETSPQKVGPKLESKSMEPTHSPNLFAAITELSSPRDQHKAIGESRSREDRIIEIPRNLTAEDLRNLTQQLAYEVSIGVGPKNMQIARGDKAGDNSPSMYRIVRDPNSVVLDLHSHPVINAAYPEGYTAQSISNNDVCFTVATPSDSIHAVISESQLTVWGRPTKIPEGTAPYSLSNADASRELMLNFLENKGISILPFSGHKYFSRMDVDEQDKLMQEFIIASGMLIAQIPWSDTARSTRAMEIINTATSRRQVRQKFTALQQQAQ